MEDKEKLSEGEKLHNLTNSDDWHIVKDRFEDVILALADIRNIPFSVKGTNEQEIILSGEQRTYEMQVRERTLSYLQNIFSGLTADVEEYKEMIGGLKDKKPSEDFIIRFDNKK